MVEKIICINFASTKRWGFNQNVQISNDIRPTIETETMKFKYILTAIIIGACSIAGTAQTQNNKGAGRAHAAAHKQLLAKQKSGLDNTVINEIVKNDIQAREAAGGLSAESSRLIDDLLKEAHRHLGKPYVHGAKGPSQFDCSGFSSYVYRQFGYNISPGSRMQYTQGTPVKRNDLRKGDLVFFTSRSSGKNVGHVGIVVTADNEKGTFTFVHASLRGVKVSNFEGYYVPRYIGARRIIKD